jgi:hypothetical protein
MAILQQLRVVEEAAPPLTSRIAKSQTAVVTDVAGRFLPDLGGINTVENQPRRKFARRQLFPL